MKGKLTESEFTRMVLELAKLHGWRTAHFRPALTKSGKWVTAVQGDGKGFPDLVLVRGNRGYFVELKVPPNKLTQEQHEWLQALKEACHNPSFVMIWTPADWPEIEKLLAR